jgi:hypothetical protein
MNFRETPHAIALNREFGAAAPGLQVNVRTGHNGSSAKFVHTGRTSRDNLTEEFDRRPQVNPLKVFLAPVEFEPKPSVMDAFLLG